MPALGRCRFSLIEQIQQLLFIKLIDQYQNMQLVTKLGKGNSIRDKKNSIIHKDQMTFSTPVKASSQRHLQLNASRGSSSIEVNSVDYSLTSAKKDGRQDEQALSEPKNAFSKKCFQKRRQILPIQNLLETYNSRTFDKKEINKHPENIERPSSRRKGVTSVRKTLKNIRTNSPIHSIGPRSSISVSRISSQSAFRSLSHSKRIKYSIIRNQDDC